LESREIAKFISDFNAVAVGVLVFLAIYGIFAILHQKLKGKRLECTTFFQVFCVAALAAFAAETTFFNYPFYLKYFAGAETEIVGVSEQNQNILLTSDGTLAEILHDNGNASTRIVFKNLDRNVTSLKIDIDYDDAIAMDISIQWKDEGTTVEGFRKYIHKYLPFDNYAVIQPTGKVSELSVLFGRTAGGNSGRGEVKIVNVMINKQVPLYFSGIRLLAISLLLFAIFLLLNKNLRTKMSYYLIEYKFNPACNKQKFIYALAVVSLILFSWVCIYTSPYNLKFHKGSSQPQQYSRYLVDAIIAGRTFLDHGTPEKLLGAERPYDPKYRANNYNGSWELDWAWYKGKNYCYYGVVPAVILYAPYKIITGDYMSNHAGIFLFVSIAVILLALLWRHCVKKYMPDSRFAFFLLSFVALFFASGLFVLLHQTSFYSIAQSSGYMFAVAGMLLLFKSIDREKINHTMLFFACLCFALIAGCRPSMIFVSLLVPVVLWKHIKSKPWKLLLFISIPYIIVAIPIMYYNYVRFDSIFEFGQKYAMTTYNSVAAGLLNPIGKIVLLLVNSAYYLFSPNEYSLTFPYIKYNRETSELIQGILSHTQRTIGGGMINFPIVFCLLYLLKKHTDNDKMNMLFIMRAFLIIAAVIITAISVTVSFSNIRFIADFAIYIAIPSLFCAYYWSCDKQSALSYKFRLKIIYALLAASIIVGLFITTIGGAPGALGFRDLILYRYLEYSLSFI
jgi:hypothetical protein